MQTVSIKIKTAIYHQELVKWDRSENWPKKIKFEELFSIHGPYSFILTFQMFYLIRLYRTFIALSNKPLTASSTGV